MWRGITRRSSQLPNWIGPKYMISSKPTAYSGRVGAPRGKPKTKKVLWPLERVITIVVNTEEVVNDVEGDEYWLVLFFLDLFDFHESKAPSFGNSPIQIFANHLFHGKVLSKFSCFQLERKKQLHCLAISWSSNGEMRWPRISIFTMSIVW